jgi:hypothetical protein
MYEMYPVAYVSFLNKKQIFKCVVKGNNKHKRYLNIVYKSKQLTKDLKTGLKAFYRDVEKNKLG